jgi:hypothetical protein
MKNSFDKYFYLICNFDVLRAGLDAKRHFSEFGIKEHRISNKSFCEKNEVFCNSDLFYSIKDLIQIEFNISDKIRLKVFQYKLPWRLGCQGFPPEIYEISFIQFRKSHIGIIQKDDYIILPYRKLLKKKCYLVKI